MRIRHPEPSGSRWATPALLFQHPAGQFRFGTRGKIVANVGNPPKRVGISEWDSLEQAQAYLKSAARKDLVEGKKVVKINRQYVVEASK